ncbi:hypothetical protein CHS0354_023792 [Potamilus streckersoni]|uniref:Pyrrolo-quinoline quinone repeat domain-containing protein n=1 Tax=Potamilus streckersoni TaxID=2493646 RepID=A0AAE0VL32_9BIVA|nr:hypothetical protein CHS0354_023792 [Potamilus streckersoni]
MVVVVLSVSLVLYSCGKKKVGENTDWAYYGNDLGNMRYSALDQINDKSIKDLSVAWQKDLEPKEAYECTPIVVGGTMYVTTPLGPKYVYALNAKTGEELWKVDLGVPQDYAKYACCGLVNRAPSYGNGKVFVGRLDGKLTALDAKTGKEVWTVTVIDYKSGAVITSPPLVVGNKVVTGHGGGEYGTGSRISAYDSETGKELWLSYTVPQDDKNVTDTWKGESFKTGGSAPWLVGSYDKETNTIFWGTSNPSPWNATLRGDDPGKNGEITHKNLYSSSTLALDAETGKIKWHYQKTPFDAWDYDGVNEKLLATIKINGVDTKVVMEADRNGFFYVNNRADGKLISADPYVKTTWAKSVDIATGMPVEDPMFRTTTKVKELTDKERVWPSFVGGKNWEATSFNPNTGLVYIPANNLGMTFKISDATYDRGNFYLGAGWTMIGEEGKPGEFIAWDPVNRKKAWSVNLKYPMPGGSVTTKGNLVFFGDLTGMFYAYNAMTGDKVWEYKTESGVVAAPMTYQIDGVQYVAVIEGRMNVMAGFIGGELGEEILKATPAGGKVNVFALKTGK